MADTQHKSLVDDLTEVVWGMQNEGFDQELLCSGFRKAYALWMGGGWGAVGESWPAAQKLGFSSAEEWHIGVEVVDWFAFVIEEHKVDVGLLVAVYDDIVRSWKPATPPKACITCKDPLEQDSDDEECWSCQDDRCDGCGNTGAAGDDAYDGYCPVCADKIEVHREGHHRKKIDPGCPRCRAR